MKFTILLLIVVIFFSSCDLPLNGDLPTNLPQFSEDSAYLYIKNQVDFGPRIPNTTSHDSCGIFLAEKLISFKANVILQKAKVKKYKGNEINITNIIAEFYPEKEKRILLFAHWDTRPYSDYDDDTAFVYSPFDSANDGASGVGVLLELARIISQKEPEIGVDIILFDAEDQGEHKNENILNYTSWCLGSQYWANNLHKENYKPFYAISLDMVGDKNAKFTQEDNSRHFAAYVTKRIWEIADELGYSDYFVKSKTEGIIHDHLFIAKILDFKTLIIIEYSSVSKYKFNKTWHTQLDNLSVIDKNTLKVVGQTLLNVIYLEK